MKDNASNSELQQTSRLFQIVLGLREDVNEVITQWLQKRNESTFCVFCGNQILENSAFRLDLLLNLRAKATLVLATQSRRIIQSIPTGLRSFLGAVEGNLGFRIHNANGDRIVMRNHAVHSEANQSKIPGASIASDHTSKWPCV